MANDFSSFMVWFSLRKSLLAVCGSLPVVIVCYRLSDTLKFCEVHWHMNTAEVSNWWSGGWKRSLRKRLRQVKFIFMVKIIENSQEKSSCVRISFPFSSGYLNYGFWLKGRYRRSWINQTCRLWLCLMYPSGNRAIGSIWKGEGKPWNLVCCTFKQTLRQICDQQQEQEPDVHLSLKLFYCLDSSSSSGVLKAGMVFGCGCGVYGAFRCWSCPWCWNHSGLIVSCVHLSFKSRKMQPLVFWTLWIISMTKDPLPL